MSLSKLHTALHTYKGGISVGEMELVLSEVKRIGGLLLPKIPEEGYELYGIHRFKKELENQKVGFIFRQGYLCFKSISLKLEDLDLINQEWVDENITPEMFYLNILNTELVLHG